MAPATIIIGISDALRDEVFALTGNYPRSKYWSIQVNDASALGDEQAHLLRMAGSAYEWWPLDAPFVREPDVTYFYYGSTYRISEMRGRVVVEAYELPRISDDPKERRLIDAYLHAHGVDVNAAISAEDAARIAISADARRQAEAYRRTHEMMTEYAAANVNEISDPIIRAFVRLALAQR